MTPRSTRTRAQKGRCKGARVCSQSAGTSSAVAGAFDERLAGGPTRLPATNTASICRMQSDVVEGFPGTAMMSASFPDADLPVPDAADVGGNGRVRPRACALLIPSTGKALTPWRRTLCGLFGPTPASVSQTMRAPALCRARVVGLDGRQPLGDRGIGRRRPGDGAAGDRHHRLPAGSSTMESACPSNSRAAAISIRPSRATSTRAKRR